MKLWTFSRGYWFVVVLAPDENAACELADAAWQEAEGWEGREWIIEEHPGPVAIIGWT